MYSTVLIPTDGSKGTDGAIDHAIDVATTYDAALHTLYVVDTDIGVDASIAGTFDALEDVGRDAIDEVVSRGEAAGVDQIEGAIAQGKPHRAILEYVDEHDVDLVVMGTHGRTGLNRYLIGSVTERVVRLSDTPVLTVPMRPDDAEEPS
ncbi:universal stress protein [Halobaculum rubrum]|uniref:universal stress protein n=1 Tax=Halobaculum rubrum TaxID=2872158 RepID=UPI001CA3DE72|nr:universal stress protein [Halobaculum rubrum]QZY00271.1 universal stress protein [Halobaculum rubrum]